MTYKEAIEYGKKWDEAIESRGDTSFSDARQFLGLAIKALEFIEENFPSSFIDYLGDTEVSPTEYFKAKHGIEFITEKGDTGNETNKRR